MQGRQLRLLIEALRLLISRKIRKRERREKRKKEAGEENGGIINTKFRVGHALVTVKQPELNDRMHPILTTVTMGKGWGWGVPQYVEPEKAEQDIEGEKFMRRNGKKGQ